VTRTYRLEAVDTEAPFLYPTAERQGTRAASYRMTHDVRQGEVHVHLD
jgi:hypothetical protein